MPTRIVTLPKTGGDFGTAFDCDIQLPDRSGQVAIKHGCFIANKDKMMVQTFAGQSISLQGVPLAPGKSAVIEDGTIIGIADYIMLVSIVANMDGEKADDDITIEPDKNYQAYFSHKSLDEEDFEDNKHHENSPIHNHRLIPRMNLQHTMESDRDFSSDNEERSDNSV